jgi:predicted phage-related endonuclease
MKPLMFTGLNGDRRRFIGGSDARIIMGQDEKALVRLWKEKRGEVGPEDLSTNLIVQLGLVTEDLNRQWYERNTGSATKDVQSRVKHPVICWMAATLDRTALLPRLLFDSIAEPHARAASILVDKLDARFFQNSFDV